MIISYLILLISGQLTLLQFLQYLCFSMLAVMIAMSFHEFSHALAAKLMGDRTAKEQGRLSLNPLAHLDPMGLLLLLLFGIGFAKPVNVNPRRFKNPRLGMILTAAAGPLSNLILAFALMFGYIGAWIANYQNPSVFLQNLLLLLNITVWYNIVLAVFNLIPLPPLDGSKILGELLPPKMRLSYYNLERYRFYIWIGLILVLNRTNIIETVGYGILSWFEQIILPVFI